MMRIFRFVVIAAAGLLASPVFAAGEAAPAASQTAQLPPDALVRNVTEEVLNMLRQNKERGAQKTTALVESTVLPHFNFEHMTALAVGREWRKASAAQKEKLVRQFHDLLLRTYANAVISYRDQKVRYKPFKMKPDETDVLVRTEILQPGARSVQLDYSLEKTDGGWKVYDVMVAGVSLVVNYRASFSEEVRNGGIDGLIESLANKNASLKKDQEKP
ncbi:MAG: ABC transporter substrate-binding protein [Zoogloeaceae bacterium]|jgi:phospholipid transport system substrate-binding protein|nr:ABC transporter substrate-binding protein [Zoogloeaceae bacterium]